MRWIVLSFIGLVIAAPVRAFEPKSNGDTGPSMAWVRLTTPTDEVVKQVMRIGFQSPSRIRSALGKPDFVECLKGTEYWWYRCGDGAFNFGLKPNKRSVNYTNNLIIYEQVLRKVLGLEENLD
jgi:hypothetical protein